MHWVAHHSRFLIRAPVHVLHLASQALAQVLQRLPADWPVRSGYAPVLVETFVAVGGFPGVSDAAAHWQAVGRTQGRGRQDTAHQAQAGKKIIWVHPLQKDFRAVLRAVPSLPRLARLRPPPRPAPPPAPPSLWAALALVATLGGWLGRKSDAPPGVQVLGRGLQRLAAITATWKVCAARPSGPRSPPVSSNPEYG